MRYVASQAVTQVPGPARTTSEALFHTNKEPQLKFEICDPQTATYNDTAPTSSSTDEMRVAALLIVASFTHVKRNRLQNWNQHISL